jgi:hypothetical protein
MGGHRFHTYPICTRFIVNNRRFATVHVAPLLPVTIKVVCNENDAKIEQISKSLTTIQYLTHLF